MVDALPGTQPQVIRSRYQEGKTQKAISETIGVNHARVSAIEHEALRELRKRGCKVLAAFLPEAVAAVAYRHNGVGEFNRTWTSSTELVALKMY